MSQVYSFLLKNISEPKFKLFTDKVGPINDVSDYILELKAKEILPFFNTECLENECLYDISQIVQSYNSKYDPRDPFYDTASMNCFFCDHSILYKNFHTCDSLLTRTLEICRKKRKEIYGEEEPDSGKEDDDEEAAQDEEAAPAERKSVQIKPVPEEKEESDGVEDARSEEKKEEKPISPKKLPNEEKGGNQGRPKLQAGVKPPVPIQEASEESSNEESKRSEPRKDLKLIIKEPDGSDSSGNESFKKSEKKSKNKRSVSSNGSSAKLSSKSESVKENVQKRKLESKPAPKPIDKTVKKPRKDESEEGSDSLVSRTSQKLNKIKRKEALIDDVLNWLATRNIPEILSFKQHELNDLLYFLERRDSGFYKIGNNDGFVYSEIVPEALPISMLEDYNKRKDWAWELDLVMLNYWRIKKAKDEKKLIQLWAFVSIDNQAFLPAEISQLGRDREIISLCEHYDFSIFLLLVNERANLFIFEHELGCLTYINPTLASKSEHLNRHPAVLARILNGSPDDSSLFDPDQDALDPKDSHSKQMLKVFIGFNDIALRRQLRIKHVNAVDLYFSSPSFLKISSQYVIGLLFFRIPVDTLNKFPQALLWTLLRLNVYEDLASKKPVNGRHF